MSPRTKRLRIKNSTTYLNYRINPQNADIVWNLGIDRLTEHNNTEADKEAKCSLRPGRKTVGSGSVLNCGGKKSF